MGFDSPGFRLKKYTNPTDMGHGSSFVLSELEALARLGFVYSVKKVWWCTIKTILVVWPSG